MRLALRGSEPGAKFDAWRFSITVSLECVDNRAWVFTVSLLDLPPGLGCGARFAIPFGSIGREA